MVFKFEEKANWKDDVWEKVFQLVEDFKKEYKLKVKAFGISSEKNNKYYFSVDKYDIWITVNSKGFLITFESDTTKEDFDEKFNFIIERIK